MESVLELFGILVESRGREKSIQKMFGITFAELKG
jgi:hypothetical protein